MYITVVLLIIFFLILIVCCTLFFNFALSFSDIYEFVTGSCRLKSYKSHRPPLVLIGHLLSYEFVNVRESTPSGTLNLRNTCFSVKLIWNVSWERYSDDNFYFDATLFVLDNLLLSRYNRFQSYEDYVN